MNIALHHELLLYNELLSIIQKSLEEMIKGLKGLLLGALLGAAGGFVWNRYKNYKV